MDKLPKSVRQLVHEYGLLIVVRLREAGYDGENLRRELEVWRQRRQDWLLHN